MIFFYFLKKEIYNCKFAAFRKNNCFETKLKISNFRRQRKKVENFFSIFFFE